MELALQPGTEELWGFWKRLDRERYFASVVGTAPEKGRTYRTQFGQSVVVPDGLEERQAHKAAKHMAVGLLTPPQRAAYEGGTLFVYVVDALGRRHILMHGGKGCLLGKGS